MTEDINERVRELGKAITYANTHQHVAALHNVLAWAKTVRLAPGFEASSDAVMDLLEEGLKWQPNKDA